MRIKVRLTVKHLLPVLVIAALSIWMAKRWNVWFGNVPEQPYSAPDRPSRIMLTFGDELEGSRNISWQCDSILHPSMVQTICLADSDTVYTEAAGEIFASRRGRSAYYVARLRHLKAGREYAYRVVTDKMASPWYHFHTYEPGRSKFSFLYVGDVQDTLYGKANMFLRQALKRHPQSEFIVCGGDLTERPTDQHWTETYRNTDSVAQAMPLLCVTGNHDYLKGVVCQLERRFSLIHSYFLDSMIGENQVFTVCYQDVQMFCLDGNREFFYLATQRKWLREQMSKSQAKWKIVVIHHPLYSIRGSMNNLIQRWMFDDIIREHGWMWCCKDTNMPMPA